MNKTRREGLLGSLATGERWVEIHAVGVRPGGGVASTEAEIVWLEDIDHLDYLRQSLDRLPTCKGRPAYHRGGRTVG
ncbi:hypothetical protein FHS35_001974 [Streptomyces umbrinus]|nr:hypothetical protein [Streptomyces umbrinus]GHH62924.1 hypothetical protein GCM10018775_79870 [Streptomyces umbrinus]